MSMNKLVSVFAAAAALGVAIAAPSASAATCTPSIPNGGLSNTNCGAVGSPRANGSVTITQNGAKYSYTINLQSGISSSGTLLNADGTQTRDNTFPSPGNLCPQVVDQTIGGSVPSKQCNVRFVFAGKTYRILVG